MKVERKTKAQLIDELTSIKLRLTELEKLEQTFKDFNEKMSLCEEKYNFFLSNMDDLIVKVDNTGKFIYVSPSYCKIFGKSEEELIGNNFMPLVHEEDQEITRINFEATFNPPYKSYVEQRAYTKDGWRWFAWHDSAVLNDKNEVVAIIGVGKDITQRKEAEENLSESESILKSLVNNLPLNIILKDTESKITYVNEKFAEYYKKPANELIGKSLFDIYPKNLAEQYRRSDLEVLNNGKTIENFEEHCSAENIHTTIQVIRSPFYNNKGEIKGIISISWDITEKKRAEEELLRSKELLSESQRIASLGHYVFNAKTGNWISSATLDDIFGIDENYPKNISGWNDLLHPDYKEIMTDYLLNYVVKKGNYFDKEYKIIRHSDKKERWVHGIGRLKFDDKWNVIEMFGTIQDITERKHTHLALEESEKKFRLLAENSTDLIARHKLDGTYLYVSPSFEKVLGYKPEELIGKNPFTYFHKDDVNKIRESLYKIIETEETSTVEYRFKKKDGIYIWLETTSKSIYDPLTKKITEVHTATRDITERKRNEIALKESEELYRSLVNASPDAILVLDLLGNIRLLSNRTLELFEADKIDNYLGLNAFQWIEDKQKAIKNFKDIINGIEQTDKDYVLYTTKGKRFFGEISASVLYDAENNATGIVAAIRDITERKRNEELLLRTQFSVDKARDAVFWISEEGKFVYVNDSACNSLGYSKEELLEMTTMDIDRHYDAVSRKKLWNKVQQEGSTLFETEHTRKDGTTFPVEISSNILNFGSKKYNCTFVRDITERKRAAEALLESEERFRNMLQNVPTVAVQGYREDGTIYYWNKASENFYGYTAEEVIGRNLLDTIIPPEMVDEVKDALEYMSSSGIPIPSGELSLMKKDGSRITVYSSHSVIRKPGQKSELFCIDIDISERKKNEDQLKIMAEILDNAPNTIIVHDYKGNIYYANKEAYKKLGYEKDEFYKLKIKDIDSPECAALFDNKSDIVELNGEASFEVVHVRKDGLKIPMEIFAKKVYWGNLPVVISIGTDITERKRINELLQRTQASVDKARDAIFWIDAEGYIIYVNESACNSLQYSKEELLRMNVTDFDPDVTDEKVKELWNIVMDKGSLTFETRHRRKDGTKFPIEISCYKLSYGGIDYNCTFVRDITERKKAEEELRKSEQLFNTLAKISPVGIFRTDPNGKTTYVNPKWSQLSGLSSEQAMGDNWLAAVHPEDKEKVITGWKQKISEETTSSAEYRFLHPDGNIIWVIGQAIPEYSNNNEILGYVGTITDITNQKLIEQELRENEEKFRTIIEQASEGFILVDNSGNIVEWNNAMASITSLNREKILNKSYSDIIYELIPTNIKNTVSKEVLDLPIKEFNRINTTEYFNKSINLTIQNNQGEHVHIRQNIFPLTLNNIKHLGFLVNDVTDQINSSRIIENYIQVLEAKNAELERFTYTVSHDLKSPVITIKGFLGMLIDDAKNGKFDRMEKDISRISNAADKMQSLLDDLLQLSRIGRIVNPSTEFSMTEIVKDTTDLLQGIIKQKNIKISIQEGMPIVVADKARISEVFQNLIENAIKYSNPEQKEPLIEIGCKLIEEKVHYYVKDNGIGIKKEYHQKIFELFEKLDSNSEGTGIGLAFVKRIIELHRGKIWVESDGVGKGSTFFFYLNSPNN